jgi:hypothetical protein
MVNPNNPGLIAAVVFVISALMSAQTPNPPTTGPAEDYSGMYTFVKEGEFVQITIEDDGRLTGFVSRYGDSESDRGAFLDQFFKERKIEGNKISFTTETVHAVWFEFKGTFERGSGRSPREEAYHVLKGTLLEYRADDDKKTTARSRDVVFKSFPQDDRTAPDRH